MTTATEVLFVLFLICVLLVVFLYSVGIIVGCWYLISDCCKKISKRIEKSRSESTPSSHVAPLDQSDARLANKSRNYLEFERRENRNNVDPESAPVAPAAAQDQADTHPDKVLEERKNQKKRGQPSPGGAILTIENENADMDYSRKTIPSSIELKTPVSIFKKASAKEKGTRKTKTTKIETTPISDPKTAILTIENEESDADDSDSEKRLNTFNPFNEFKYFPPDSNVFLQSPSEAPTKDETKKSKNTQPLPLSTKAKHLYPKCNSAAQACR